jgi:hypothetical protein
MYVICVQGLYREEYVRVTERAAIACLSCPVGWQTKAKGATSKRECTSERFLFEPFSKQLV